MTVSEDLQCLFTARLENRSGEYVISVPENEVEIGELAIGETYKIAILPHRVHGRQTRGSPDTPVSEGERITVQIEDLGQQGDGIARVGPGYIVFVPETEIGDRVTVQIRDVTDNFAFGEVVED